MRRTTHSLDESKAFLINVLSVAHRGHSRGISAEALATRMGMPPRTLRTLITRSREEGILIGGTPDRGYFICESADEVEEYCHYLTSRALKSLMLVAKAKRVGLPALLGQMSLKT